MPDAEASPSMPMSSSSGSMNNNQAPPRPDPTMLTTQQLLREISNVAELLRSENEKEAAKAEGGRAAILIRIDDIQRQTDFHAGVTNNRFDIIETQRVEQKQDNEKAVQAALLAAEKAVQAALLAQKEAVREQTAASALAISKSESSTAAQQSQQYATITAELKAVTDRLGDQGNRLTTIESVKIGTQESRSGLQMNSALLFSAVLFIIALIGFFALRTPPVVVP